MVEFLYLYSGVVYFTTLSLSETVVSNGRMNNEWRIRLDMEEGGRVLFLCIIPSLAWRDGEKPRSLCQGGQCRGLAAGRRDFVICSCQPWLPYTTNVKSTSAVVFYQPVCFYLPLCLCSLAGCLFLHKWFSGTIIITILYVLFHPWIESITTESD
jgi:hypothetical protein